MSILGASDIEHFVDRGWCVVPRAFTSDQAAAARDLVWQRMETKAGIRRNDPQTWPAAYDIEEQVGHPRVLECFTDRVASAVEEIVGVGRWANERRWGFWPVSFHYGAEQRNRWPHWGWHVDGNWFTHTIDCPRQGLLVIGLFSDITPGDGGTIVSAGSHKRTARVLAAHPQGLTHRQLFDRVLAEPIGDFHELTGNTGDVVLAHPFLFHTRGFKRSGGPRFISNTEAPLRSPMLLERADGDYSVLERSIRAALREAPLAPREESMQCCF